MFGFKCKNIKFPFQIEFTQHTSDVQQEQEEEKEKEPVTGNPGGRNGCHKIQPMREGNPWRGSVVLSSAEGQQVTQPRSIGDPHPTL